jgi:cbb3-type cytochrome oxidase maturation protein
MTVLVYLIPISLALGLAALFGFIWTVRSRQYDDLDGPAHRILNDDQSPLDPRQAAARRHLDIDGGELPKSPPAPDRSP